MNMLIANKDFTKLSIILPFSTILSHRTFCGNSLYILRVYNKKVELLSKNKKDGVRIRTLSFLFLVTRLIFTIFYINGPFPTDELWTRFGHGYMCISY